MVLKSLISMKGAHKLKIMIRIHRITRYNYIKMLVTKGEAKIPDELKVSRYPLSFHFYDPIPRIMEHYTRLELKRLSNL
jgi:hypothetical protein